MNVVLDACVPRRFKDALPGHQVTTVGELLGTTDFDDGPLFVMLRGRCEVFVTTDRNIPFLQNISALPFALIILRARSNRLEPSCLAQLQLKAFGECRPGEVQYVGV